MKSQIFKCMYLPYSTLSSSPCKFCKILVVGNFFEQNFILEILVLEITSRKVFYFFIWYDTAVIKQSSSYFSKNFPHLFAFASPNEVSQRNIFFVFFFYIWSSKVNSIFIIIRIWFCSVNSILIGSFSSSSFTSKSLLLYLIKALATGLPVGKIL